MPPTSVATADHVRGSHTAEPLAPASLYAFSSIFERRGFWSLFSPRELAVKLREQLSALSYHVRVLAECSAVELVRTEQIRGSTPHFYCPAVKAEWAVTALDKSHRVKERDEP